MKIKRQLAIVVIAWIIGIGSWITYEFHGDADIPKPYDHVQVIDTCIEDTFNIRDFVLELHIQGIKYPDVILRQACLESGWFTSLAWRKNNNPFGFVGKDGYILFNDWKSAIAYYKTWQDKYYKSGDYYLFLEKIKYATDTNYVATLKSMDLSNLKSMK